MDVRAVAKKLIIWTRGIKYGISNVSKYANESF